MPDRLATVGQLSMHSRRVIVRIPGSQDAVDPKATLRGRARSELAAVLGAVTADALTLEGPIGSFSLTCIATQSTSERLARSPTSIYLALVGRRRAARPAGAYRAIAPDFRERSNEPIDL